MIYMGMFLTITTLFYAVFLLREERIDRIKKRLAIIDDDNKKTAEKTSDKQKNDNIFKRIAYPAWVKLRRIYRSKVSSEQVAKLEQLLLQAGSPFSLTAIEFRMLQILIILVVPVIFVIYGFFLESSLGSMILLGFIGLIIAFYLPYFYLKQKVKERNKIAQKELPDILDLLTVSLEAGLGFDSALTKVVSRKEGVLSQEFQRCLEEIRLGKSRREALNGIKERLTLNDVNVLISNVIQAEKLGIGLVKVFRVQSNEVRERRRQRAEEAAMKAPIKILFPLVLFIFPSIFIVLLGPAILQFMEVFNK